MLGSDLVVAQLLHQLRPGNHRRYPGSRRRRRRLRHHRLPPAGPPLLTVSPPVLPDPAGSPRPPDLVVSGLGSIWWACSCRWIPQRRGGLGTGGCGRETGKSRPEDDEATRTRVQTRQGLSDSCVEFRPRLDCNFSQHKHCSMFRLYLTNFVRS